MKATGIVCEYNPFHNGHEYHICETRRLYGSDYIIGVMSGDFTQRGMPAITDKYSRTRMALLGGCDVVIELPVRYATASAEGFATAAISTLAATGICDSVCFGTELGSTEDLTAIADILCDEPITYSDLLTRHLNSGEPYPLAREHALTEYTGHDLDFLHEPNNILALEYIKACRQCSITPHTIKRNDAGYHKGIIPNIKKAFPTGISDQDTSAERRPEDNSTFNNFNNAICNKNYISAEAIRELMFSDVNFKFNNIQNYAPMYTIDNLGQITEPKWYNDIIYYSLLSNTDKLVQFTDISDDMADRIRNNLHNYTGLDSFISLIKTRNYTYTRIARAIIHCLLGIRNNPLPTPEPGALLKDKYPVSYIRVLGFRKEASCIIKELRNNASVPVITRLAKADGLDNIGRQLLSEDITSSELYEHIRLLHTTADITNNNPVLDYTEYSHGLVIL